MPPNNHSTPKDRVLQGLDTIPVDRTVEVSLRDLMFVHQMLGEFVQFFRQPTHWPNLDAVQRFMGGRDTGGGTEVLFEAYYERMRDMIPADIDDAMNDTSRFEHPLPPDYFVEDWSSDKE
ncbi:hypothetical protein [Hydrogenophaga sp. 5NK40-0174]|uniref:hypothetical protein n=1 Tax=Hydrogenophaga sp. 5NK40-0174 TaxID=3127649 RepID=UPI00310679B7